MTRAEIKSFNSVFSLLGRKCILYVLFSLISGISVFVLFSSVGILMRELLDMIDSQSSVSLLNILLYIAIIFLMSLLGGLTESGFCSLEMDVQAKVRRKMLESIYNADLNKNIKMDLGELFARITDDASRCAKAVSVRLSGYVFIPMVSGLVSFIFLFFVNIFLAFFCLAVALLNLVLLSVFRKRIDSLNSSIAALRGNVNSSAREILNGSAEIRIFGLNNLFLKRVEEKADEIYSLTVKKEKYANLRYSIYNISADGLTSVAAVILAYFLSKAGYMDFADVFLARPLADQISQMLVAFSNFSVLMSQIAPSIRRTEEVMDMRKERKGGIVLKGADRISFENVSFSYPDGNSVLHGISFTLEKGKKYAFVGESGSGKSTILKLLMGFYMPTEGKVTLNGVSSEEADLLSWRGNFSYLNQSYSMLNTSIAQNIAFSSSPDDGKVLKTLESVNALSFIRKRNLDIHEKRNVSTLQLSGGERQRISVARVLYQDNPVLVLDEATSALDKENRDNLSSILSSIGDKIIVSVTHQMDFLSGFDQVFAVSEGKIERLEHLESRQ